jgi:membrane-associated protease RseP (regulator of RpoE activity)
LLILINLNIFIGLFNMLPMLPLDGGYVAIATYERLRRRGNQRYQADLNKLAPVVYAFVAAIALLFVSTLYLDIAHPLANPFH